MASGIAGDSSNLIQKICEVSSSDSSETSGCYEEYGYENSSSMVVPTMSSCTSDTSTTVSRIRCVTRSLASVLQKATPSNLCWKKAIRKNPPKGVKHRLHLVILIQNLLSLLKGVPNFQMNRLLFHGVNYFVLLARKSFLSNKVSSKTTFIQPSTKVAKKIKLLNKTR